MSESDSPRGGAVVGQPSQMPLWGRIMWNPTTFLFRMLFRVHGGYRVIGAHHIPRKGGVLICPNHVCDVDPPAVAGAMPRRSRFIAKHDLFEMRILNWVLPMFGVIPIRRDTADRVALKTAISCLKAGEAGCVPGGRWESGCNITDIAAWCADDGGAGGCAGDSMRVDAYASCLAIWRGAPAAFA